MLFLWGNREEKLICIKVFLVPEVENGLSQSQHTPFQGKTAVYFVTLSLNVLVIQFPHL